MTPINRMTNPLLTMKIMFWLSISRPWLGGSGQQQWGMPGPRRPYLHGGATNVVNIDIIYIYMYI